MPWHVKVDTGKTDTKAQRMEGHPGCLNKVTFSDDFTPVQCEILFRVHIHIQVFRVLLKSLCIYARDTVLHLCVFTGWDALKDADRESAFPPNKSITPSNAVNMERSRGVAQCCHCTKPFWWLQWDDFFFLYQGTKFRVRNSVDSDVSLAQYLDERLHRTVPKEP